MDTKKDAPEIQEFKLAKVGDRKRRKGAGFFWFGQGAGRGAGGFMGSLGGGGGAGGGLMAGLSGLGGKIAVALLVSTLGAGAYSVGKVLGPNAMNGASAKPRKLFADPNADKPKYDVDASKLPGGGRTAPSSGLSMVSGSLDGMTPAQREAKAKAEADAAKAAADAQAKADAEAAKGAAAPAAAPAGVDPAAIAAAAGQAAAGAAEKKDPFGSRFGKLSSGLGGGLSGGGGLAGGVNRNFEAPKFKSEAGKAMGMVANRPPVGVTSRSAQAVRNPGRGLAQRQLNRAVVQSNQARAMGANTSAASTAAAPFDNNDANGQSLGGAGAGNSGTGTSGRSDTSPSSGGGGGGSLGSGPGYSGYDDTPDDCGALATKFGWGGSFVNAPGGGCIRSQSGTSHDPTDRYFDLLKVLSIIASLLGAVLLIAALLEKNPYTYLAARALMMVCGGALCAVGAIMALLGLMIVGMGRTLEGGIFAVMGIATSIAGYMAYASADKAAADAQGVEKLGKEAAQKLTEQAMKSGLWAGGIGSANVGSAIYANNVHSRTLNPNTQEWE